MFTINKILVVTAAVIATGLVAAVDIAKSGTETAAATVAARFPSQAELMLTLDPVQPEATKPGDCTREHWPYIADECLTRANGAQAKRPIRTITIERRIATAPATQVASR